MKLTGLQYWVAIVMVAAIDRMGSSCSCYGCLTFHGCDYKERNAVANLLEQSL